MQYHFYIIFSESIDKYYVGHTYNLQERLKKHNANHKGFTGRADDWIFVYSEKYNTKEEAYRRERQVKAWKNRRMIERLIEASSEHPDFTSGGS